MEEFAMSMQQLEVSEAVGVAGEAHLSGISALRNMMWNVDHDDKRQTSHAQRSGAAVWRVWEERFLKRFPGIGYGRGGEIGVSPSLAELPIA